MEISEPPRLRWELLPRGRLLPFALPNTLPTAPAQLYDLAQDPGETVNLYEKYPKVAEELKQLLDLSIAKGRSAPVRKQMGVEKSQGAPSDGK